MSPAICTQILIIIIIIPGSVTILGNIRDGGMSPAICTPMLIPVAVVLSPAGNHLEIMVAFFYSICNRLVNK